MSDDPIKDLEDFNQQGLTVNPLPPSEVRRLGDRMRRRNAAFAAVGAAAAIAVIVTPLAVFAGGRDHAEPPVTNRSVSPSESPSESPSASVAAAIPDDFPIAAGLVEAEEGSDSALLADQLTYCDLHPLGSVEPLDTLSAELAAGESSETRTLLLFDDGRAATNAEQALLDAVAACPTEDDTAGGIEHEVIPESADWPGRTIQSTWEGDAYPTARFVHVVRTGPALLLTSSYAGGPADLEQTRAGVAPLVAAMAQFGDVGPDDAPPPAEGSDIPADFPIDADLPDMTGDGGEITGPSTAEEGLGSVTLCGTDIWPVSPNDRLAVTSTGPEYRQSREVVTFMNAEAAVSAMTRLRQQVQACPSQSGATGGDGSPTNRLYRIHNADTGYESLTFSSTLEDGSLGGGIYQFIRVGHGVLAMYVGGEWAIDTVDTGVAELTETSSKLTPAMCVFTEAGC